MRHINRLMFLILLTLPIIFIAKDLCALPCVVEYANGVVATGQEWVIEKEKNYISNYFNRYVLKIQPYHTVNARGTTMIQTCSAVTAACSAIDYKLSNDGSLQIVPCRCMDVIVDGETKIYAYPTYIKDEALQELIDEQVSSGNCKREFRDTETHNISKTINSIEFDMDAPLISLKEPLNISTVNSGQTTTANAFTNSVWFNYCDLSIDSECENNSYVKELTFTTVNFQEREDRCGIVLGGNVKMSNFSSGTTICLKNDSNIVSDFSSIMVARAGVKINGSNNLVERPEIFMIENPVASDVLSDGYIVIKEGTNNRISQMSISDRLLGESIIKLFEGTNDNILRPTLTINKIEALTCHSEACDTMELKVKGRADEADFRTFNEERFTANGFDCDAKLNVVNDYTECNSDSCYFLEATVPEGSKGIEIYEIDRGDNYKDINYIGCALAGRNTKTVQAILSASLFKGQSAVKRLAISAVKGNSSSELSRTYNLENILIAPMQPDNSEEEQIFVMTDLPQDVRAGSEGGQDGDTPAPETQPGSIDRGAAVGGGSDDDPPPSQTQPCPEGYIQIEGGCLLESSDIPIDGPESTNPCEAGYSMNAYGECVSPEYGVLVSTETGTIKNGCSLTKSADIDIDILIPVIFTFAIVILLIYKRKHY